MSVKLTFEVGHQASRKTKPSKGGFTHDWELFVRGPNEASDIGHFVEKVVFNLHDSFPKPKRVIKEPPYTVKEAGYAGFVLTIDIHLKNRDEPKKFSIDYDLDLQPMKIQTNEIVIHNPSDDFKRKCLKGGAVMVPAGDFKNRESYGKGAPMPAANDMKKPAKRPEENKPNKIFTDLFGAVLKKPDPRALQNSSPNPTKLQTSSKAPVEKISSSSASGSKEKGEKSKHKHSPNKDGKESKKSSDGVKPEAEKSKKDKTKDRERSDKKEKVSKRPSSPSPSSMPTPSASSSSAARNSTNLSSLPVSKNDLMKPQTKQSSTPTPTSDSSFNKKSNKKDKKSHDKERERNEKKDSRAKEALSSKEKSLPEPMAVKSGGAKERDVSANKDDRDKGKTKPLAEPKTAPMEPAKKQHDKDSERKHKHKKKEKSKDKDVARDSKKEKPHKLAVVTPSPAKAKETTVPKYEPHSDSDVESPPSIKQESDNSISDAILQKPPPEIEKVVKKPRERTKAADKEDKSRKRKSNKKDDRDSSVSPPPAKVARKDVSKSPSIQERPSSSDSAVHQSHMNNNNIDGPANERKISNEYMSELKDLKQKITTLKNNDELQHVVRMIAATGCYEITKSSFDFDLVQLDRGTVQRLQEFFATS